MGRVIAWKVYMCDDCLTEYDGPNGYTRCDACQAAFFAAEKLRADEAVERVNALRRELRDTTRSNG